jgi:hypothetical protein
MKELAMADEPLTVRAINWRQTFPFINLFRAFRVAVHPSKLVLALVALILLYVGGQVLDLLWPMQYRAIPDEVALYDQFNSTARPGQKFIDVRKAYRDQIEAGYAQQLLKLHVETDPNVALQEAREGADLSLVKNKLLQNRNQAIDNADAARRAALASAAANGPTSAELRDSAKRTREAVIRQSYTDASAQYASASEIRNLGLFDVYFDYEANQVSNVVRGVRDWNWFGEEHPPGGIATAGSPAYGAEGFATAGVVQSIYRFFTVGPMWLLTQHPLYFALIGILTLAIWSIFGGAICRIAAVHVARDEKLSIRSALMFSGGKFLSFLFAPIIPLLIVVGVGLLVTLGSALANIPYVGPIFVGLVFILALACGFLMALVLLGLIGGFNLMYPTVAVEGSDSFDAISRSFSYLYARPWRLGFYTILSVIYGAVSYLFVRFFIYVMLLLTHKFAGLAIFTTTDSAVPLWTSLWPNPGTAARLSYDIDTLGLSFAQEIGARMIWLWVHLVIAMLGAFVVCFYFSSNTIIYYLMRREVDATDIDDVYLEQPDDEFGDPLTPDVATTPAAPAPTHGGSVIVSESPTS